MSPFFLGLGLRMILGSVPIYTLTLLSLYVIPLRATGSSLSMSSLLEDFFNDKEFFSPPQKPAKPDSIDYEAFTPPRNKGQRQLPDEVNGITDPPHRRRVIRRRVLKVLATTEEEEFDCENRGGTPCTKDAECCLGKCSNFGKCPTASELFDAAAITLKKERDKKNAQNRKSQAHSQSKL